MEEGALYWATCVVRPKNEEDFPEVHIIPLNDTRTHTLGSNCWCRPRYEMDDDGDVYIHLSADGREDYEAGLRKPH